MTIPSETLASFGRAIRARRSAVGMSQEELALASNLDRTYIGGVERGERNLSLLNIAKIAQALNVRPSELLQDAERLEEDSNGV